MRFFIEAFEGFRIAVGALGANKLRAFLTLLGIVVGVSTVIGIISLTDGLDVAFGEQISALGSDVLYVNKYPWVGRENWEEYRNRKDITMEEVEALKKYGTLFEAVSPTVQTRRTVKYLNRSLESVTIVGTDDSRTSGVYPQFGRDLNPLDVANRRQVCVIGYDVADKLFTDTDPIGKYLKISGRNYLVIGVMEKQGDVFGQTLDQEAKIPIGAFFKMYGRNRNISIQVKVKDPLLMEEARDEIRGILRRVRTVPPGEEDDFAINQMDMIMRMYQSLTGGLYAAAIGVGAISLLVGGIGIMNIMLVSVTERTREIGIRKAIGAKRRDLLWQFLIESVLISLIGGVIGIAAGFALGKLVASVSPLPAVVSPMAVLLGMGFSSAVGIFFGLYPASKAARLDPIVALRYE